MNNYKFTLVTIKNPFNVNEREIRHIKIREPIKKFVTLDKEIDFEVYVTRDINHSAKVHLNYVPENGDFIVISPFVDKGGGKNILSAIAGIALSVVTMGVGSTLSGGAFMGTGALGVGAWTVGATIGAIATMAIGGSLISNLSAKPKVDLTSLSTKNKYGWSQTPSEGEGEVQQVTYGTVVTSGHVLAKHITSDGDKQYLNILLCGGEGAVDEITDVKINNNPIANYKDIVIDTRLGTNDQTVITNFADTYDDEALSYELNKEDYRTHQTMATSTSAIEIVLEAPVGIYHITDGGKSTAWVKVKFEYRKVGATDWLLWDEVKIEGKDTTAIRKIYTKTDLEKAQYEVRCIVTDVSGTNTTRDITKIYWTCLSSIIFDDFTHPNKILIGIKALATDQLNGSMPTITWKQTRNNVRVYNPVLKSYENKPANNPAWAMYDVFHNCKNLKNIATDEMVDVVYGIAKEQMDYTHLKSWADSCTRKNIKYNATISSATKITDAIKEIESVGRSKFVLRGTKISCIFDDVNEPCQMFNMSNIVAGSFKEEFLKTSERANAIEVSFNNIDNNYEKTTIMVYADNYNEIDTIPNTTQISFDSYMTLEQAYREAKFRLRLNQYLIRTIYFDADIDSIECQVGDIVYVQHDVPQWGLSGGRIAEVIDTITLKLSKTTDFETGKNYSMLVRHQNDVIAETTITPSGIAKNGVITTDTITIADTQSINTDDIFSIGENNKIAKPFRIFSITRSTELKRKITALEYIEEVYAEDDVIPSINYSYLDTFTTEVQNINISERNYMQKNGVAVSEILCSWNLARNKSADEFLIYTSTDGGITWNFEQRTMFQNVIIKNIQIGQTYLIKIKTVKSIAVSNGVISNELYITGKDAPPADVESIEATIDNTNCTKIKLKWNQNEEIDWKCVRLWEGNNIIEQNVFGTSYIYTATESRPYIFKIKNIDNSNGESANYTITSITTKVEPADVPNFQVIQSDMDKSKAKLSWDANKEADFSHYVLKVNTENNLDTATIIDPKLKVNSYEYTLQNQGVFYFFIQSFNTEGYASNVTVINKAFILKPSAPTNFKITQNLNNKTHLILTYENPTDKDFVVNEFRLGNDWATGAFLGRTKEEFYNYISKNSGLVKLMICSQNLSGNYSDPVYVQLEINVEPNDVTNFKVEQLDTDRSMVRFFCDASSELDFRNFLIKYGDDWTTGIIINNTMFDYKVTTEGNYTFFIKAVNLAGIESFNATSVTKQITLKPSSPTNGKIVQDATDKSWLTITWDAVKEGDISKYVILDNAGVEIDRVADTTYKLQVNKSDLYNYAIKAMTIAGNMSNALNLSIFASLEPPDITGFTVIQSTANKSILKCKWDAVAEKGKIIYEIRQGVDWVNSTLIQDNIQTNYFDFTTTTEGTQSFFIKAKNTVDCYSQGYATAIVNIVLIPTAPTTGVIQQDYTNKALLNISWSLVRDTDYLQTEVRQGSNWDTATPLPSTMENKLSYTVSGNGTYTFLVRAKNIAGYYSAILQISAIVVLNPSDVTGFNLVQNTLDRRILNFTFNANTESDFAYYVIRKGSNWDTANLVKSNITNNFYDLQTATEGTETYLIKAVNKSGNYSVNPALVTKTITLKPNAILNLVAVQNVQDKSRLDISWSQSSDTDFSLYELTINSIVLNVKDNKYQYSLTASGNYTIAVRVKTVGGSYSPSTTIICSAMIEAQDITGLTVSQSLKDRSKLTLQWNKFTELDAIYAEIRQGVSWDNSTLVDTKITGLSYQVTISDEVEKTYWIKAVNLAGKYSQNAVSTPTTTFNLNPSAPSNLTVIQDVNDRSNIIVSWDGNGEYDFKEIELRIGDTWDSATIRKVTVENNIVFNPTTSGDYKFIIKSRNTAGFDSDEVSKHSYATLEPSNVINFQVAQNGEYVELQWDKSTDADVTGYKIIEGSNFESGTMVVDGVTTTNFEYKVDTERTYQFHIKAINRSGKYSQFATITRVTVTNLPDKNVVLQYDEIVLKSGTHTNTEFGTSLINASNIGGRASDYPNTKASEVGGQMVLKLKNKNVVTNGDFSNGLTGWFGGGANISLGTNEGISTATCQYGGISYTLSNHADYRNHKIYARAYLKSDNVNNYMVFLNDGTDQLIIPTIGSNTYEFCSGIRTIANNSTTLYVKTQDARTSGWTTCRVKGVLMVDLTAMFGAGNEPTKSQCDAMFGSGVTCYQTSGEYLCATKDVGQVITANISTLFYPTNILNTGVVAGNAKLQYRTSQDNITWSNWVDFKTALVTFRYVAFKVVFTTSDTTKTPEVNTLQINIDVPDTSKTGTATIPSGGLTISYGNTFWTEPCVIAHAVGVGSHTEIQSKNNSSFVVKVLNNSNTDVGGKISWQAIGY